MGHFLVIGVFGGKGTAEDAVNRLSGEGIGGADVGLAVLKEIGPIPSTMEPELDALSADPFFAFKDRYAKFIHNGETVVWVRAASEDKAVLAADTLYKYSPVELETITPDGEAIDYAKDKPGLA